MKSTIVFLLISIISFQVQAMPHFSDEKELSKELKEKIRGVLLDHSEQVKKCHETTLNQNPNIEGRTVLSWEIDSNGKVTDVTVKAGSEEMVPTSKCVAQSIRGWRFPKPTDGKVMTVSYPFVFLPQRR